jgi:hypothetical protein
MPYRPSKREDAKLGFALILSPVCAVATFFLSFTIAFHFLLMSGLVKFRILWPAPSKMEGIAWFYGVFAVAILLGVLIGILIFRVTTD